MLNSRINLRCQITGLGLPEVGHFTFVKVQQEELKIKGQDQRNISWKTTVPNKVTVRKAY